MPELSVITDGISPDFARAATLAAEAGLRHVELQTIDNKPVGDLSPAGVRDVKRINAELGLRVACLSHKSLFGAMPVATTEISGAGYQSHMEALGRVIAVSRELDTRLVRIMCFRKESVLFGSNGAETAVVSSGAWDRFVQLMEMPVRLAEREGIQLVVETSTKGMITSAYLARKLVDEIGSKSLKVLWDPANAMYFNETPSQGYETLRGGYLGHVHIKDCIADIPRARIDFAVLGEGQMGPHLATIAKGLADDAYEGYVSLESIYRPPGGTREDGFRTNVAKLKQWFQ